MADEPQAAEWKPSFPLIRRIDEIWVKGERILCGAMFLIMSVLVFFGVVASVFANRREWVDPLILFGFVLLALRTRALKAGEQRWPPAILVGVAAGMTVALSGLVVLYTKRYPGGITEVRPLALCMMLWVSLLGASIATFDRSHLALEMGEKLWPAKILHLVKALARGLASGCCVLLLYLTWIEVSQRHDFWASTTGGLRPDIVPGLSEWGVPAWLVLLIMPYTFAAMAIRMAAQAITLAARRDKPLEERLPS